MSLFTASFATTAVANAAEPGVPRITLEAALVRAEAQSPEVRAARSRVAVQRAEVDAVGAAFRPTVSAFAAIIGASINNTTTTTLGVAGVDFPRVGATRVNGDLEARPYASTMIAASGRQLLTDFGRTARQRESVERRVPGADARTDAARLDARAEAADAFFAVLTAEAIERITTEALARANSRRDLVAASAAAGMFPPVARTLAEADVARFELARARAHGLVRAARASLAAAVASDAAELDADDVAGDRVVAPLPAETTIRAQTVVAQPAIRAAEADVLARRAATRAIDASSRPSLFLTGGVSTRGGGAPPTSGPVLAGDGFLPWVPNYHVGIVLSAPLYDPTVSVRHDIARAEEEVARHVAEGVRLRAVARAVRARTDAEIADAQMDALTKSLDASTRNFEQADTRFRAGIGSATELADAESRRVEAEVQLAIGRFDRLRARALLERAIGAP